MLSRILVVDLDDTLLHTDSLYESVWACASKSALNLLMALMHLVFGRARFKAQLSSYLTLDASRLPYNDDVLNYIGNWRQQGGRVALVTATDQSIASAVAAHLGVFDEVYGSDGGRNLKGGVKAKFLVERYGASNYDYIGDAAADFPVWASAQKAITVGLSPPTQKRVRSMSGEVEHLPVKKAGPGLYLKALRPHQWSKNVLVFLPLLTDHEMFLSDWIQGLLAFISFSLVASSVYVLNDLLDLSADRAHPRKRLRPFASGALPLKHGTLMAPALLAGGVLFGVLVNRPEFLAALVVYYAGTMLYSLVLKRKMVVDILALAGLYSLRIFGGGAATDTVISKWLLAFSIFFFFALAAVKRQGELVDAVNMQREKAAGRGYVNSDLPMIPLMAIAAGYVAVLIMALYLNSPDVSALYRHPLRLWGICVILLYWISRMVMMAHRGQMNDDPIVFSIKDPPSRYCGVVVAIIIVAAMV
jgi:4-hydroxybenzoate polyprenyltransferase